jgi:DNA-binding transcriptional regulator YhcF (GntR family)
MAPTNYVTVRADAVGRVRARLLTALHVGKLQPGDRVPSVRSLSRLTGINHKTVHRAYTVLAREGILQVRPGSGTFVTERRTGADDQPATAGLIGALERCRDEALQLGLAPRVLSRFLDVCLADGLRDVPVGLVECNREQIAMIGRDARRALGIAVRPILLGSLERDPRRALGCVGSVVTTDCHWSDVAQLVEPLGVPTYTVSLEREFPQQLLRLSRSHDVYVVARDRRFGGVLDRLLKQLSVDEGGRVERIRFVERSRATAVLRGAEPGSWVYFAPLAGEDLVDALPCHANVLERCWHVEARALESLRAGLALDVALQRSAS